MMIITLINCIDLYSLTYVLEVSHTTVCWSKYIKSHLFLYEDEAHNKFSFSNFLIWFIAVLPTRIQEAAPADTDDPELQQVIIFYMYS